MVDLSYIVPIYKTPRELLEACLASIRMTEGVVLEVICVIDSPGDPCQKIAEDVARIDSRVKVVVNERNMGVSISRNRGLEMAQGRYVTFVDADDWIFPRVYQKAFCMCHSEKLAACAMLSTRKDPSMVKPCSGILTSKRINVIMAMRMSSVAVIYDREVLVCNGIRFPDGVAFNEDFAFITRVLLLVDVRVGLLDELGYVIVGRPKSASRQPMCEERIFDGLKVAKVITSELSATELTFHERRWYMKLLFREELFPGAGFEISRVLTDEGKAKFAMEASTILRRLIDIRPQALTILARMLFELICRKPSRYFGFCGAYYYCFKVLQKIDGVVRDD